MYLVVYAKEKSSGIKLKPKPSSNRKQKKKMLCLTISYKSTKIPLLTFVPIAYSKHYNLFICSNSFIGSFLLFAHLLIHSFTHSFARSFVHPFSTKTQRMSLECGWSQFSRILTATVRCDKRVTNQRQK